jgi:hypothetical protein
MRQEPMGLPGQAPASAPGRLCPRLKLVSLVSAGPFGVVSSGLQGKVNHPWLGQRLEIRVRKLD